MTHGYYRCEEDGAVVGDIVGPFDGSTAAAAEAKDAGLNDTETIVFRWSDLGKINKQMEVG